MDRKLILIVVVAVLIGVLVLMGGSKERYGGIIKNIKRLPFNYCASICDGYRKDCLSKYSGYDAGWCEERFGKRGSCVQECYYSSHHRQ